MKRYIILCFVLFLSCFFIACNNSHEHKWGKWKNCYDGLTHTRICKDNPEHTETENHNYDDGEILQQVSDLQNGIIKYTCEDCGYEKQTILAPLGNHNFVNEIVDDKYIVRKVSSATSVYYKCCSDCGAFGNENYVFEKTNLPDNYLELEYIKATGNQYIDIDYLMASENAKVEIKCSFPSSINDLTLFGSRSDKSTYTVVPYHHDSYGTRVFKHWIGSSGGIMPITMQAGINQLTYTMSGNILSCVANNQPAVSANYDGSIINGRSIFIFGLNNIGVLDEQGLGYTLYNFKLYDNNILVRDLVPVMNLEYEEYGLYDVVSNRFFTNNHNLESSDNIIAESTLPEGFKQVEYIESDGSQYIDTLVEYSNDITYKANCAIEFNNLLSENQFVLGFTGNTGYGVGTVYNKWWPTNHSVEDNKLYEIEYYKKSNDYYFKFNGTKFSHSIANTGISKTQNLLLFASWETAGSNKIKYFAQSKMYYCKIYKDDILVRDMIPCVRILDNKSGFYDLITEQFFTYSNDFNFGKVMEDNSIPETYTAVEYLQSSGTQYIDTGIIPAGSSLKITLDYQYISTLDNQSLFGTSSEGRMSLNAAFNHNNLWQFGSNGWQNYSNQTTCDLDIHTTECYWGNGLQYCKIDDNIMHSGNLGQLRDNSTLTLFNHYNRYFSHVKIYSCKIYYGDILVRDFIPAVRNKDGKPGLFDTVSQSFYTNASDIYFKGGEVAGHDFDDGVVLKETTYYQDGDIIYTCRVCGKKMHKYQDKYAHQVAFNGDSGIENIKVFNDYNPNNFEYTTTTYTRNKKTFNYSKIDSIVIFEINLKNGFVIDKINLSNTGVDYVILEDNRIVVSNIYKDLNIIITTKQKDLNNN